MISVSRPDLVERVGRARRCCRPTSTSCSPQLDHPVVHPDARERLPARRLRLRRLVLVVGEQQVRRRRRGSSKSMPSSFSAIAEHSMCQPGAPRAPRRRPGEVLVGLLGLPEREVERVLLAVGALDALALVHLVDVAVRELAVRRVRAHAEVDVAARLVGVPALDQGLDQVDDLRQRLRGQRLVVGPAELRAGRCPTGTPRSSRRPGRPTARPAPARRRRSCR